MEGIKDRERRAHKRLAYDLNYLVSRQLEFRGIHLSPVDPSETEVWSVSDYPKKRDIKIRQEVTETNLQYINY